ncbi:hypothetical protein HPB50_022921 [Hyalomma asiaticum]|uniref:Uncharacterized protein n=1 Tax=Hyalomma asiaticum TaxID=266040 RepID=A0ACB7SNU5_HYAAI|nr:hypothetical protein HPB50_022921 [Hyalomma asiaticum]
MYRSFRGFCRLIIACGSATRACHLASHVTSPLVTLLTPEDEGPELRAASPFTDLFGGVESSFDDSLD